MTRPLLILFTLLSLLVACSKDSGKSLAPADDDPPGRARPDLPVADDSPDTPQDTDELHDTGLHDRSGDEAVEDSEPPFDVGEDTTDLPELADLGDPEDLPDSGDLSDLADTEELVDAVDVDAADRATDVPDTETATDVDDLDGASDPGPNDPDPDPDPGPDPDITDAGLPPPERGYYLYDTISIPGFRKIEAAAFHPDGTYLVLLERYETVHVYDVAEGSAVSFNVADIVWEDITFDAKGEFALLVGEDPTSVPAGGAIHRFDDAAWRAYVDDTSTLVTAYDDVTRGESFTVVEYPWDGDLPLVVSIEADGSDSDNALWRFDPAAGDITYVSRQTADGPASDAALITIPGGEPGVLLACDQDVHYYDPNIFDPDRRWRTDLGGYATGNVVSVSAHRGGDYALLIGNSGRRVFRFQSGIINESATAPHYCYTDIRLVEFQPNGRRALVAGGHNPGSGHPYGGVVEYRHGLYDCVDTSWCVRPDDCDLTDVHILNFESPPFSTDSQYNFDDIAWNPTCDGGVLVGGKSYYAGSYGLVVTFEIAGGVDCWD